MRLQLKYFPHQVGNELKPNLSVHNWQYRGIKVDHFRVEKGKNENPTTACIPIKFVYFFGYLVILKIDAIKKAGWHLRIYERNFPKVHRF